MNIRMRRMVSTILAMVLLLTNSSFSPRVESNSQSPQIQQSKYQNPPNRVYLPPVVNNYPVPWTSVYLPFVLDKFGLELLVTDPAGPRSLVVDSKAVYWVNQEAIMALYKNQSQPALLASGYYYPSLLTADADFLYWVDMLGGKSTIYRMPKAGGQPVELAVEGWLATLTVDEKYVYWRVNASTVMRLSKLGEGVPEPAPIPAMLFDGPDAYWLNSNNELIRSGKDGSSAVRLMKLEGGREISRVDVTAIFPKASDIYFTIYIDNYPGVISCTDQRTELLKISRDGSGIEWVAYMPGYAEAVVTDSFVYFSGHCTYALVKESLSNHMMEIIADWPEEVTDMAEDTDYVYWADVINGWIKRIIK